ncbi:coiled-coil domain-containing protein [Humibacter ginsengiterrae]
MAVRANRTGTDRRRVGARLRLAALGAAVAVAIPLVTALPAHADDYPSWDEVQAAKANAAAAQAEYNKIAGLIAQLQQAAEAASTEELKKEFEYTEAKNALDAQTSKLGSINQQAATAQKDATQAKTQYGKLASQLYISGGGSLTAKLLLSKGKAENLLDQLGSMSQLTGHISQLQNYAKEKQNVVTSLQGQAKQAEDIRTSLEQDADTKYKAAQAAKAAADAALATQQQQGAILQAQAASLNAKAAAEEQQRNDGLARDAAAARAAAASAGGSGSNANVSGGGSCTAGCSPGAAQAYAQSAAASRYGWGSDQFSCLQQLWTMESGWRWNAYNSSSAAYGIPQSWPAWKMSSAGADYMTNGDTQINWGLSYISSAYGSPCAAWDHEMSQNPHWY